MAVTFLALESNEWLGLANDRDYIRLRDQYCQLKVLRTKQVERLGKVIDVLGRAEPSLESWIHAKFKS